MMKMKVATKEEFFNQDTICIFTDASYQQKDLDKIPAEQLTSPAYCVYLNDQCLERNCIILNNCNSQQGELYALFMGVNVAVKYYNLGYRRIKIFSDNQNAVLGIREWIFRWIRETNSGRATFGANGRISNQEYYMDIIYTILANRIFLEFYHIKGHVDLRNKASLAHAKYLFLKSNPFVGDDATDDLIYYIAMGNNDVDYYSTTILKSFIYNDGSGYCSGTHAIRFEYDKSKLNMNDYKALVNKNGRTIF